MPKHVGRSTSPTMFAATPASIVVQGKDDGKDFVGTSALTGEMSAPA